MKSASRLLPRTLLLGVSVLVCLLGLSLLHPHPASAANLSFQDSNGNGVPDGPAPSASNGNVDGRIEQAFQSCWAGQHTYHGVWMNPYYITPSATATSTTLVKLYGTNYICPGVSYSSDSFTKMYSFYIDPAAPAAVRQAISIPSGATMSFSKYYRGQFSSVQSVGITIDLTKLPSNQCTTFYVDYTVSDQFATVPGWSWPVSLCYFPQSGSSTNNLPTGAFTSVQCTSATSGTATATFRDADGATSAYVVAGITQLVTRTTSPGTWSVTIPVGGSVALKLYVKDVGASGSGGYVAVASATLTNASCLPSGGSCPGLPGVDVGAIPASLGAGNNGETTYTTSGGSNWKLVRNATSYQIVSATDAYGRGLPVNTANSTVDFSWPVQNYPYDSDSATVRYTDSYMIDWYKQVSGSWVYDHTSGPLTSAVYSDGSASVGDCDYRKFDVQTPTAIVTLDNAENPHQALFNASVPVQFSQDLFAAPLGLRHANQVTLDYTAFYYVSDNGTVPPPGNGPFASCRGSLPLSGSLNVPGLYTWSLATGSITPSPTCNAASGLVPPLAVGQSVCVRFTFSPTGTLVDETGAIKSNNGGSISGYGCSARVINEPYAHAFGQDILAGGAYATGSNDCVGTPMTPGDILGYDNAPGGPLTRGSAVQIGALALGNVNGFASASLRTSTPIAPGGLTFANNGTLGNLGTKQCVPDYFATLPTNATPISSQAGIDTTTPGSRAYYMSSGTLDLNGLLISDGVRIAIYVDGTVNVSGSGINYASTTWQQDRVPSVFVVAHDIYISPTVGQMDGVYVAQPHGGGTGVIDTCGNGARYSAGSLYSSCSAQQLTVHGAFIAQQIYLDRTVGSLRNAYPGEHPPAGGVATCLINGAVRSSAGYDCAAEIFDFSPEVYLARPAIGQDPGTGLGYDYITSLSPVL